jgi:phage shock protein E
MMLPNCGALVALGFLSLIAYLFWRGTVVAMIARQSVSMGARLVDAGTAEEFDLAHVSGSVNIPAEDIARRQGEIGPRGQEVVIYARSGYRSAWAAHVLRSIGYRSVVNVGPMTRWAVPGLAASARDSASEAAAADVAPESLSSSASVPRPG